MSHEPRPITADEIPAFRAATSMGFGEDPRPDGHERFPSKMPLSRTVAVFDGHDVVGTLGDFPLQLTVPGGAQIAMAGTTMVTVRATHTRRGILRSMVTRHLDNAVELGESVAGLWASEPGIYGRFGFGLASECHTVQIDARHLSIPERAADIEMVLISADQIPEIVAPYWHKVAGARSGFIDREQSRWQDIVDDPESSRDGNTASRHVVAKRAGEVVGYVQYRQRSKWEKFVSGGSVSIGTLVADDHDAHMAVWGYVLDVDLFPTVDFWNGAVDDPLSYQLNESRAVQKTVSDALYIRILDVASALTARSYELDGEVVFRVDDDLGYTGGTFKLRIKNGHATVEETSDTATVCLGIRELGALYLGRSCVDLYATTGHITGDSDAVRQLGQLFATARAPWCPEMF